MTILDLDHAVQFAQTCRNNNRPVTLCHGTFDLLHPGHLDHLRQAKEMGGPLVVSVTSDARVNKGPGRPVFNQNERATMLSALWVVDAVVINDHPSACPMIRAIKPARYVKGPDYMALDIRPNSLDPPSGPMREVCHLYAERKAVEHCGGVLVFTRDRGTRSSTELMARIRAG